MEYLQIYLRAMEIQHLNKDTQLSEGANHLSMASGHNPVCGFLVAALLCIHR